MSDAETRELIAELRNVGKWLDMPPSIQSQRNIRTINAADKAADWIEAALAVSAGVGATVPGWRLVPEEPDLNQQNAGWAEVDRQGFATEDTEVAPIYRAMLAAAPPVPVPSASLGGDDDQR